MLLALLLAWLRHSALALALVFALAELSQELFDSVFCCHNLQINPFIQ